MFRKTRPTSKPLTANQRDIVAPDAVFPSNTEPPAGHTGSQTVEVGRDPVELDLEQYRALRAEILLTMEDSNQTMAFGLTAIGLVANVAASTYETAAGFLLLGLVIPVMSGFVMSLWFAAQERMGRAAYFISGLERRFQSVPEWTGSDTWELWLRPTLHDPARRHFWATQDAAFGVFALIAIVACGLSLAAGGEAVPLSARLGTAFVMLIIIAVVTWHTLRRYKKWKDLFIHVREPSRVDYPRTSQ